MKHLLWIVPLALLAGGFLYLRQLQNAPPEVGFVQPVREQLVSAVSTNGRVEPLEYAAIRSESQGSVVRVAVEKGQRVAKGALIAELDASRARADLATAEARIAQVQAELDVLVKGGRPREITEINNALARARLDLTNARREVESLERLVEKKAAPGIELTEARQRVAALEGEIRGLEQRTASLVSTQDRAAAEARLREAQTVAAAARRQIEEAFIRAPLAGVIYQLDVRPGAYMQPGDLAGYVGKLDEVRVVVYVDEPELGRVAVGQPVTVTWDALPSREWTGTVQQMPTQIVALGSRQVGEVLARIENPDHRLLPQTNVNAEIRTSVAPNALTIPKEVLRRENGAPGVFVLQTPENTVRWQSVKLGTASVTRLEVLSGLSDDSRVALPTDVPLENGMRITPAAR